MWYMPLVVLLLISVLAKSSALDLPTRKVSHSINTLVKRSPGNNGSSSRRGKIQRQSSPPPGSSGEETPTPPPSPELEIAEGLTKEDYRLEQMEKDRQRSQRDYYRMKRRQKPPKQQRIERRIRKDEERKAQRLLARQPSAEYLLAFDNMIWHAKRRSDWRAGQITQTLEQMIHIPEITWSDPDPENATQSEIENFIGNFKNGEHPQRRTYLPAQRASDLQRDYCNHLFEMQVIQEAMNTEKYRNGEVSQGTNDAFMREAEKAVKAFKMLRAEYHYLYACANALVQRQDFPEREVP